MKNILFVLLVLQCSLASAQDLHPLEPIKNHYAELATLDATVNRERAHLEKVVYPPSKYNPVALLYILARPAYLSEGQVEQLKKSVQYPANSSEQTQAELKFLLQWQAKRTATEKERAANVLAPVGYWPHIDVMKDHADYQQNLEHLFFEGREVLGGNCTPANYPATLKLMRGITTDMRIMEFSTKYHLLRPRPYEVDPKLKPLAIMSSPSFASGHTLWAYIQAFTWSELVPTKRKEFLDLAYEIGESREIMGIHYPSDEEAARVLAHSMLSAMWSNASFLKDLDAAKQEWKN